MSFPMVYQPTEKLDPVQLEYQHRYWRVRIGILLAILAALGVYWLELIPS